MRTINVDPFFLRLQILRSLDWGKIRRRHISPPVFVDEKETSDRMSDWWPRRRSCRYRNRWDQRDGQIHARSSFMLKTFRSMTCHILRALYRRFRLHMVHQPILERVRRFGCAIYVGKFVTRHAAPVLIIDRFGQRANSLADWESGDTISRLEICILIRHRRKGGRTPV